MIYNNGNNSFSKIEENSPLNSYIMKFIYILQQNKRNSIQNIIESSSSTIFKEFYGIWEHFSCLKESDDLIINEILYDFKRIKEINEIKSKKGHIRAWIRLVIEKHSIQKNFVCLANDNSFFKNNYNNSSIVRDSEKMESFLRNLSNLRLINIYSFSNCYGGLKNKYMIKIEIAIHKKSLLENMKMNKTKMNIIINRILGKGIWLIISGALSNSNLIKLECKSFDEKEIILKDNKQLDTAIFTSDIVCLSLGRLNSIRLGFIDSQDHSLVNDLVFNQVEIFDHVSASCYRFHKRYYQNFPYSETIMIIDSSKKKSIIEYKNENSTLRRRLTSIFNNKRTLKKYTNVHYDIFNKLRVNYERIINLVNGIYYYQETNENLNTNKNKCNYKSNEQKNNKNEENYIENVKPSWKYSYFSFSNILMDNDGLVDIFETLFKHDLMIDSAIESSVAWNHIIEVFRMMESKNINLDDNAFISKGSVNLFMKITSELIKLILKPLCPYDLFSIWLSRAIENIMLADWIQLITIDCYIKNKVNSNSILMDRESRCIIIHFLNLIDEVISKTTSKNWIDVNFTRSILL